MTPYTAGRTATSLAPHVDLSRYMTRSGRALGAAKVDEAQTIAQEAFDGALRYARGPATPAVDAGSVHSGDAGYVTKDRLAPYLTEAERYAQAGWADVRAGLENPQCRSVGLAALALGWFIFRR